VVVLVRSGVSRGPNGKDESQMISALEALDLLREGNRRFQADVRGRSTVTGEAKRKKLVEGQAPFAVILGCSDSRVPAEIVFDQGLGDLFVIRVAGNITAPSIIGSVEFAADALGTRLVVVLGHSGCGAVGATLRELDQGTETLSPNLRSIVDRIRPALEPLLESREQHSPAAFSELAVRANVRASADELRHGSELLERLIDKDGLGVVGAEYSLGAGLVDFFDGVPGN